MAEGRTYREKMKDERYYIKIFLSPCLCSLVPICTLKLQSTLNSNESYFRIKKILVFKLFNDFYENAKNSTYLKRKINVPNFLLILCHFVYRIDVMSLPLLNLVLKHCDYRTFCCCPEERHLKLTCNHDRLLVSEKSNLKL